MGRPKKTVTKSEVEAKKETTLCTNCDNSGAQCSVCTPVFKDTFGA